jgi:hypothetical protein
MQLQPGEEIRSIDGRSAWRVAGGVRRERPGLMSCAVDDLRPGTGGRSARLFVPDYSEIRAERRRHEVGDLRRSFASMARAAGRAGDFWPEPLDWFPTRNDADDLGGHGADEEPVLVLHAPGGWSLRPLDGHQFNPTGALYTTAQQAAYSLRSLHKQKVAAREIPLHTVHITPATKKATFTGVGTLVFGPDYRGYNPHERALRPEHPAAAPECFAEHGRLSPATDVFALGRTLLEFLGAGSRIPSVGGRDLEQLVDQALAPWKLEAYWRQFFVTALQPDPQRRFRDCQDVIRFLTSRGNVGAPGPGDARSGGRPGVRSASGGSKRRSSQRGRGSVRKTA